MVTLVENRDKVVLQAYRSSSSKKFSEAAQNIRPFFLSLGTGRQTKMQISIGCLWSTRLLQVKPTFCEYRELIFYTLHYFQVFHFIKNCNNE